MKKLTKYLALLLLVLLVFQVLHARPIMNSLSREQPSEAAEQPEKKKKEVTLALVGPISDMGCLQLMMGL